MAVTACVQALTATAAKMATGRMTHVHSSQDGDRPVDSCPPQTRGARASRGEERGHVGRCLRGQAVTVITLFPPVARLVEASWLTQFLVNVV